MLSRERDYDPNRYELHTIDRLLRVVSEWECNSLIWFGDRKELLKMLAFDVIVGNCDRHQGNWGFIRSRVAPDMHYRLAPMYDPASCLGAELHDKDRHLRVGEKEFEIRVRKYVRSATSGFGDGTKTLSLSEVAKDLFRIDGWRRTLEESVTILRSNMDSVHTALESVPEYWYPAPRRRLALAILVARMALVEEFLHDH